MIVIILGWLSVLQAFLFMLGFMLTGKATDNSQFLIAIASGLFTIAAILGLK